MREICLVTENTADLPREYLQENGILVLSLAYIFDGETYTEDNPMPTREFYDRMRRGELPTTSQLSAETIRLAYEKQCAAGKDILHIAFSSGLSGSCNSAFLGARMARESYPEANIEVVDSLSACMGEGLLLYLVCEKKKKEPQMGVSELAEYARSLIPNICHLFTVDDLNHLYRGGRVSRTAAIVGSLVGIKPMLHMNDVGELAPIGTARGKKKTITAMLNRMEEQTKGFSNEMVCICHGDCPEDAEYLRQQVEERFGIRHFMIQPLGAVLGAHTGPGTLSVFYLGSPR